VIFNVRSDTSNGLYAYDTEEDKLSPNLSLPDELVTDFYINPDNIIVYASYKSDQGSITSNTLNSVNISGEDRFLLDPNYTNSFTELVPKVQFHNDQVIYSSEKLKTVSLVGGDITELSNTSIRDRENDFEVLSDIGQVVYQSGLNIFSSPLDGSTAPENLTASQVVDGNFNELRGFKVSENKEHLVFRSNAISYDHNCYGIFSINLLSTEKELKKLNSDDSCLDFESKFLLGENRLIYFVSENRTSTGEFLPAEWPQPRQIRANNFLGTAEEVLSVDENLAINPRPYDFELTTDDENVIFTSFSPTNLYRFSLKDNVLKKINVNTENKIEDFILSDDSKSITYIGYEFDSSLFRDKRELFYYDLENDSTQKLNFGSEFEDEPTRLLAKLNSNYIFFNGNENDNQYLFRYDVSAQNYSIVSSAASTSSTKPFIFAEGEAILYLIRTSFGFPDFFSTNSLYLSSTKSLIRQSDEFCFPIISKQGTALICL